MGISIQSANKSKNIFYLNIQYGYRRISRLFWIRWKSFLKIHTQKVISETSLTNLSKSEKNAYFRHIFANNFLLDSKSV